MRAFPTEQAIRARLLAKDAEPWSNGLFYGTKKSKRPQLVPMWWREIRTHGTLRYHWLSRQETKIIVSLSSHCWRTIQKIQTYSRSLLYAAKAINPNSNGAFATSTFQNCQALALNTDCTEYRKLPRFVKVFPFCFVNGHYRDRCEFSLTGSQTFMINPPSPYAIFP